MRTSPVSLPALTSYLLWVFVILIPSRAGAQGNAMTLAYQLTPTDQGEAFPSPDGKKLVFEMTIAGIEQLFTMNVDGSGQTQVTHDNFNHETPAWSSDGKKIAYVSDKDEKEVINLINPDSTGDEQLTDDEHRYIHPNWSADSSKLIYCSDDDLKPPKKNVSDIFSIDVKTRKAVTLITGGTNTYPSWSPDGKKIVFRRMIGEVNSEVFIANSNGSEQRNLTSHPGFDGWPSWSPDGGLIVFASNRNANYQISVMNPDGSGSRLVANTEGRAAEPRWSTDGKMIFFTNCKKVDWSVDFPCAANSGQYLATGTSKSSRPRSANSSAVMVFVVE
jgi:TolB protein